jgi:hypothetical protein
MSEHNSQKVYQEFNCPVSGGGCGGYIMLKLSINFTGVVRVICPNCKHEHGRCVENGHIIEHWTTQSHHLTQHRNDKTDHEIIPTMAAFSKTPRTTSYMKKTKLKSGVNERTAVVVTKLSDLGDPLLRESWLQKFGGEREPAGSEA